MGCSLTPRVRQQCIVGNIEEDNEEGYCMNRPEHARGIGDN